MPLCSRCHDKAHGMDRKRLHGTELSTLIREGQARARASGKALGHVPRCGWDVVRIVLRMHKDGVEPAVIARYLNEHNMPTNHGGPTWHENTVRRLAVRFSHLGPEFLSHPLRTVVSQAHERVRGPVP